MSTETAEDIENIDTPDIDDFIDEDRTLTHDIKYKITTYGADFLVDGLVNRFVTGDIYVPDFQRSFIWTKPQASRFIESILLGLPTPGIFLYKELETNKFLIVDGLQRLSTLKSFIPTERDKTSFPLEKVNPTYAGKQYGDLKPEDQRQLNDTVVHATIFQQIDPSTEDDEKNSIYLVFERLNTGGTPLQPQEIRSALYHGELIDLLSDLNKNSSWRTIFGKPNARRKDEELILRFLAFLYTGNAYESPMVRFLNRFLAKNRNLKKLNKADVRRVFDDTFSYICDALGPNAFRPQRNLNAAVFESVSVTVALKELYKTMNAKEFVRRYNDLVKNSEFIAATSKSTSDDRVVRKRFEKADEFMTN